MSIALMLSLATILAQALDLGQYSEPPYPSEDTPLALAENGIVWTGSEELFNPTNYTFMRWHWECGGSGFDRPLANLTAQEMLSSGTQASVDVPLATITDILGDGEFNVGDQILFRGYGTFQEFPMERTIYRIALIYIGWDGLNFNMKYWGEYSCAVVDGKFYSWRSYELSAGLPWWYEDQWNFDPSPL